MNNWEIKMKLLQESAQLLENFNVIDIDFVNGQNLEVYVAMTKVERSIGLSTIPYLDIDGMLFYYKDSSFVPFTMLDMGFDLDIGWYDISGKLIKKQTFKAGHSDPIFCHKAFNYVIETKAGFLPEGDLKVKNVKTI